MTFAEELRHALTTDPVLDSDVQGHRPRSKPPVDAAGDEVRVYERDDEQGVQALLQLNTEKGVWSSEVWADIVKTRHDHPSQMELRNSWLAMDDEAKFRYHIQQKCPVTDNAAIWVGYRDGQPAHARLLDRAKTKEVWIQWVVGSKVFGKGSQTLALALWDIGVKAVCFKSLTTHPLLTGKWRREPKLKTRPSEVWERHHPGHYEVVRYDMTERPQFTGEYLETSDSPR